MSNSSTSSDPPPPKVHRLPDDVKARCWQTTLDTLFRPLPQDDVPEKQLEGSPRTFHPFTRLPIELREYIWKIYCPELTQPVRVFELTLSRTIDRKENLKLDGLKLLHKETFEDVPFFDLSQPHWRAAPRHKFNKPTTRKLQAIHAETRGLVTQKLPSRLSFELSGPSQSEIGFDGSLFHSASCHASLRYNRDTDILVLRGQPGLSPFDCNVAKIIKTLKLDFRKIGVIGTQPYRCLERGPCDLRHFLQSFSHLETLYICTRASEKCLPAEFLTWALSHSSHRFATPSLQQFCVSPRLTRATWEAVPNNELWCLGTEPNFRELNLAPYIKRRFEWLSEAANECGVSLLPMHVFEGLCATGLQVVLEQIEKQKMQLAMMHESEEADWETLPCPSGDESQDIVDSILDVLEKQRGDPTTGYDILKSLPSNAYQIDGGPAGEHVPSPNSL